MNSSSNNHTGSSSNNNNSREVECRVCGDKASGKHYGVPSCDGCRGFFKRSIRRNLDYVCKESGNCIVDVTRRNQCQSCRFRKCLQVNMKRDAVQHERAPRANGFSKVRLGVPYHFHSGTSNPNSSSSPGVMGSSVGGGITGGSGSSSLYFPIGFNKHHNHSSNNSTPNSQQSSVINIPGIPSGFYTGSSSGNGIPLLLSSPHRFSIGLFSPGRTSTVLEHSPGKEKASNANKGSEEEVSTTTNIANEQQLIAAENYHSHLVPPSPFHHHLESVYESAAKLLFLSIKWARSVPSFGSLPSLDQALLLENCWSELFILSAVQWGLPLEDNFLIGKSTDHILTARRLLDVLTRITSLNPDYTELACLKAVILFKPEVIGLNSALRVELYQDQTVLMLQEYCYAKSPLNKVRFGRLLLTFPCLKVISGYELERLFFKETVGEVSIQKLISDLVKSTF